MVDRSDAIFVGVQLPPEKRLGLICRIIVAFDEVFFVFVFVWFSFKGNLSLLQRESLTFSPWFHLPGQRILGLPYF